MHAAVTRSLLLAGLLPLLPLALHAESQPTNVSTGIFTLNFSAFTADRMAALADGTRFVLGSGANNSAAFHYLLKIRPDGTQAWAVPVASLWTSNMRGLAADVSGNAYVAYSDFSNFGESHARVVKFNASGGIAASADLAPGTDIAGGDGFPFSEGVAVDSARGRVYADYSFFSNAQRQDTFVVAALDTDLQPVAARVYDPGFTDSWLGPDPRGGIFTDSHGDVWVAVQQLPTGTNTAQMVAVHYTPDLTDMSVVAQDGGGEDFFAAVDPRGGMVINGNVDAQFQPVLNRVTDGGFGPPFRFDGFDLFASPMAVDPAGSLYILGFDLNTFFPAVAKVDASTSLAWGQPGPYLNLPYTFDPAVAAVAAVSSTTFDVAGVSYDSDPSPVILLHYQQAASLAPTNLALVALSPAGQDATVTKLLGAPLKVKVTEGGQPKAGVTVRWAFISMPSGTTGQDLLEAPGFPSTVVASRDVPTDANGEAAVQVKVGDLTGEYLVAASVPGAAPSQLQFSLRGKLFLKIALSTATIFPVTSTATIPFISEINRTTVTVTAFGVGGDADTVADYPLIIRSTYVVFSGGHDHQDSNRLLGEFSGSGLITSHAEAVGRTGPTGQLFAIYTSSAIGGYEVLTASAALDSKVGVAIETVTVAIPNLVLLPEATYYTKVGGTQFHVGPPASITTDHNHYGLASFNDTIVGVAVAYRAKFPTDKLRINDMGLPMGGLLDLNVNWHTPHGFHRLGTSADINTIEGLNLTLDTDGEIFLNKLIRNQDFLRSNVEGNHWHLFVEGGGPIHPRQPR